MIPADWKEVRLGEICEIYQPTTIGGKDFKDSGEFVVYGANGPIGRYNRYNHEDSEVTVTCRGATCGTVNVTPPRVWITGNAMVVRPKAQSLSKLMLKYILQALNYSDVITGAAQPQITGAGLSPCQILVPPLKEQEAIAEVLSNADASIESLDALIAKKRDMKQAAMQQLLTGATRLGGRTSPWCMRSVSTLATITKGVQLGRADMKSTAAVPVWNGGIEPSGFTSSANVRRSVVTVSEGGNSCGWVGRPKGDFWLGGHCYALEPRDSCQSVGFLYHILKSVEAKIMGLRVGSGLPNIQKTSLAEFSVSVPSEQTEANELTLLFDDLDAELDALVAQREKAELVKQGMMQELLSGRVSLV